MRGAEGIVFALAAPGEAGEPAALAQSTDAVAAAGDDLVRIGLVADVPDQPVFRRVEHVMDRDGQFDHAEAGAEMPAGLADRRDHLLPELVRQLAQLVRLELAQVGRGIDSVEQGGVAGLPVIKAPYTGSCQQVPSDLRADQVQASHRPRSSTTGRTSLNPFFSPALRSAPVMRSSSKWVVWPHLSQIMKMQSCRQPGWVLAI